jgi:hypothetical protein
LFLFFFSEIFLLKKKIGTVGLFVSFILYILTNIKQLKAPNNYQKWVNLHYKLS